MWRSLGDGSSQASHSHSKENPHPAGWGFFLFLKFKRCFDAIEFCYECFVDLQSFLNSVTTMNNCGVVATTNQLTNTSSRHLGMLLSKIHRDLTDLNNRLLTTLAEHILLGDTKVMAHRQ